MSRSNNVDKRKLEVASKAQRAFIFKLFLENSKEKRSFFWTAVVLQIFAIAMQQLAYLFIILL